MRMAISIRFRSTARFWVSMHARALLRARRKRPRRRSTDERDEFASFHWITSPAGR
jgi:hypothetical protein